MKNGGKNKTVAFIILFSYQYPRNVQCVGRSRRTWPPTLYET